jgi:hypothetical protein
MSETEAKKLVNMMDEVVENGTILEYGDALEIVDEEHLTINPRTKSHILFIEMAKV